MRGRSLWALLLIAPVLAGCIAGDGATDQAGERFQVDSHGASLEAVRAPPAAVDRSELGEPLRIAVEGPENRTASFSGSFMAVEACIPVGCQSADLTDEPAYMRVHDISELVPVGVPADIEVHLTHNADGAVAYVGGGNEVRLVGPDGVEDARGWEGGGEPTVLTEDLTRRSPGPLEVHVVHWLPEPDQPTVDYELTVQVHLRPQLVATGVPLRLALDGAGDGVLLAPPGQDRETLVSVWGPDGTLVDRFLGEGLAQVTLPEGQGPGTYTLVLHRGPSSTLPLYPVGTSAPAMLQVADLRLVEGEERPLPESGSDTWELQVDGVPARLGIRHTAGTLSWTEGLDDLGDSSAVTAKATGPLGPVLDTHDDPAFSCVACLAPRYFQWSSNPGNPLHVPGTYTLHFEGGNGPGGSLQAFAVVWDPVP